MVTKSNLEDNNLEGLPSVGPATKSKLNSIGIKRVSDLILFLPSFLIDKTSLTKVSDIEHSSSCLFIGIIEKVFKSKGTRQNLILSIKVEHIYIQIRFLHKIMIYSNLKPGLKIRFSGIARVKGKVVEMIHPEVEILSENKNIENVVPYYKTKKMISQNKLRKLIKYVYDYIVKKNNKDVLSDNLLSRLKLPNYIDALKYCHFPSSENFDNSNDLFELGRHRFVIEELIAYKLILNDAKNLYQLNKSPHFSFDNHKLDNFIYYFSINMCVVTHTVTL